MVDLNTRTRQQGQDEQAKQQAAHTRARLLEKMEQHKQEVRDRINQNKVAYRLQHQQQQEELKLTAQIGLPQMQHTDESKLQRQANQHQDEIFKAVKQGERFRMGEEKMQQAVAERKHGFRVDDKQADNRILEAGNNPTPKKDKDLDKKLSKQEQKIRAIFRNPNIPAKKKIEMLRLAARGVKVGGTQIRLKGAKQKQRAKHLVRALQQRTREVLNKKVINNLGR